MTKEMVLENLKKFIGTEFDENEIICAFGDYEENGETEVIVEDTSFFHFKKVAYINTEDATEFCFDIKNGVIVSVNMIFVGDV